MSSQVIRHRLSSQVTSPAWTTLRDPSNREMRSLPDFAIHPLGGLRRSRHPQHMNNDTYVNNNVYLGGGELDKCFTT